MIARVARCAAKMAGAAAVARPRSAQSLGCRHV
jgi:hypothetical protein